MAEKINQQARRDAKAKKYKEGSFKQAFAKNCGLQNMGSTFTWNGKQYNCGRKSIEFHEAHTFEGFSGKEKRDYWKDFEKRKKSGKI
jgi:hypothetical protein|tara:strand:- start:266 stop:526 length:261 start_codon:yes stop_codon:yes gene_type:complete